MSRQFKVGLFVIAGLALTMVAIFLIGNTSQLWTPKVSYSTAFNDVAGLKPGSPIRMGGLDVGDVTRVDYRGDAQDTRIFVTMEINKREMVRIKTDTVAGIQGKGLLGDKMVVLTVGSPSAPVLNPKELMKSEEPSDMLSAVNKVAAATEQTIERLEPLAKALGDPKFAGDIKGVAEDLHALLDVSVHGDGTMHRLFYDHTEADRVDSLLGSLDRTAGRLDGLLADFQDVSGHIKTGPGIAHAVIYDGEISKDAAGTMSEIHQDLKAIREGNGLAHAVLYGDDQSQHVMANLNAMSDDMRAIVGGMRQGKGTIGGLLVDPTIYEDIRRVVGNVQRNDVLRALVRYSIRADETGAATPQVEPSPPQH
jgi:phospholipid/cholesterol/gamma-HCH transport system substrate-binding protein